jgi:hypothetical protein
MRSYAIAAILISIVVTSGCKSAETPSAAEMSVHRNTGLIPPGGTCQAQDIANAALYLVGFTGQAGSQPPASANIQQINDPAGQSAITALRNALAIAPPKFLKRLCKDLTYIFFEKNNMSTDVNDVYAFWQKKSDVAPGTIPVRFISIPLGLMNAFPTYTAFEARTIKDLVGPSYNVTFSVQNVGDDQNTALLAAIAHEMGHILARRLLLKSDNSDHARQCNTPTGPKSFTDIAWLDAGSFTTFHDFGQDVAATHRASGDPYLRDIRREVGQNSLVAADRDIYKIYHNGNYSSLFASLAGDEDIAETYKYHVLRETFHNASISVNFVNTGQTAPIKWNADKQKCVTDNEESGD